MKKIFLLLFIIIATGCTSNDNEGTELTFPNKLATRNFTVMAPNGWKLIEEQGIDTYIGRITNGNLTIYFDQGFLCCPDLNSIEKTENTIYLKTLSINGTPAKMHKEYIPQEDRIRLSLYLEVEDEYRNRLYAMDPKNEDLIIQIFKTHRIR
ncbi:MAG TPA: hypothetical protein VFI78_00885 [Salinimicrobium sp.]|nr:hypothetical protein [Salinimicrobium sp.]